MSLPENIFGENNVAHLCDHLGVFQSVALQPAAIVYKKHAGPLSADAVVIGKVAFDSVQSGEGAEFRMPWIRRRCRPIGTAVLEPLS